MNINDLKQEIEQAIEEVVKQYDYDYADFFGEEIDIHTYDNKVITINLTLKKAKRSDFYE